ncbi:signal recognition particle-docking protein FtsY, partial [Candidatus Woesearchaeota archaeon]|nr:signal recognition particle-docking protein FtsY [Candidatus Woesearchaeota archaeon]
WNFEIILMENNVAVEVVEKIKQDLREKLVESKVRVGKTEDIIISSLQKSIENLFDVEKIDLMKNIKEKKPYVICFVGVNGSGKTTTIAKMAQMLKDKNISSVIAAADTFRAAAIHQLEEHGKKLDVKVIKHDYGADPAAVAFDAISHAKSKKIDVVLIDTAGRQHSNTNLVDEMKKIIRVANPDLKIFVGDSLTGNDTVEQSREFDKAIGIDGVVLSKVDVDEKGGAALSISYVTGKPIIYIGVGQKYSDLKEFDEKIVIDSLGLNA